jgi:hypothetical protein
MTATRKEIEALKQHLPYKWKIQSVSKVSPKAQCVAYIDSRIAQDHLDKCLGSENWQDEYYQVGGNTYCRVGINVEGVGWVWKSDNGAEGQIEQEKSLASDCFKRACVKWGLGRFLYSLPIQWIDTNEKKTDNNKPYPIDKNGKRVYDVTSLINQKLKTPSKKPQLVKDSEAWDKAVDFLRKGGDPELILKKYSVDIETLMAG